MKLIKEIEKRKYTPNSRNAVRFGLFECPSCMRPFEVSFESVKSGNTTKCYDCGHRQRNGLSNHKLYDVWRQIKLRTQDPTNKGYAGYGGRGISVCAEWVNSFDDFYNWAITNGYKEGLTIDRTNNDGNYEPSNCRWVSCSTQNVNQRIRKDNTSGYAGVRYEASTKKWLAYIRHDRKATRIGLFQDKHSALEARNYYIISNNLPHRIQQAGMEV